MDEELLLLCDGDLLNSPSDEALAHLLVRLDGGGSVMLLFRYFDEWVLNQINEGRADLTLFWYSINSVGSVFGL